MLTRNEFEARAAKARAAHYSGADSRTAVIRTIPDEPASVVTKQGTPCKENNDGWLAAKAKQALTLALVILSPAVPDYVGASRMGGCIACEHCTERDGKHYCECCGCPRWNMGDIGSDLEYKTTKAAWMCPKKNPAFGPWSPEDDGLIVEDESPAGF